MSRNAGALNSADGSARLVGGAERQIAQQLPAFSSVEVPAFRFKDVDVQVRNIDVACARTLGREFARIGAAAGVCDLIAASMRQRESRVAAADGRQLGGKVDEPMRNEVDDLALPLVLSDKKPAAPRRGSFSP